MTISLPHSGRGRALVIIASLMLAGMFISDVVRPPSSFPSPVTFRIAKGESLSGIARNLQSQQLIRSKVIFELVMRVLAKDTSITHGDFYFAKPVSVIEVAVRISGRNFGILQHNVVFPEGFTNTDMGDRLVAVFPLFDRERFLELAREKEGYLFPDTYGFSATVTPEVVVATLTRTFAERTKKFEDVFSTFPYSKQEVITMASILEKEANGAEDMYVISGILWKRIERGVPLQVDAPFYYILGKTSDDLTAKDLALRSPYNTYIHIGLPPTPIGNPGILAIEAALHPASSPYWYYLHDRQGVVHYARTFEEHKKNKRAYLP